MHNTKNLNIDIGTRCTLQCSECQRTIFKKKKRDIPGDKDMTLEQFDKISDFFKGRTINFCGTFSDPIFNPYFLEILKMCKTKNIKASVSTAASHKSEEWYLKAFDANPDAMWRFGIDGLPHDSHLYRINQDGVKLFNVMLKAKSLNINTVWQYIVFDYNKNNIEEAMEIAKKNKIILNVIYTNRNLEIKHVTIESKVS